MPIGQAGERDNLRDSTRIERDSLMRTAPPTPSWPAAWGRVQQAGHMNEPDPIVKSAANPLAQRGPSTHESLFFFVMAGLVPAIHVFFGRKRTRGCP